MKGLFLIIGESFRTGSQTSRIRGLSKSYGSQIEACETHVKFINHIKNKYDCNIDVYVGTYNTQYNDNLIYMYKQYLIDYKIFSDVVGLGNLFFDSINNINDMEQYDFVLYFRIDLFLKDQFFEIFNPKWTNIRFPCITWEKQYIVNNKPRVNDMMLYVPKKYFNKINGMGISHESWYKYNTELNISDDEMSFMINTYHDSDSEKDNNPLYYIVNRPESSTWHTQGKFFDFSTFLEKFINNIYYGSMENSLFSKENMEKNKRNINMGICIIIVIITLLYIYKLFYSTRKI